MKKPPYLEKNKCYIIVYGNYQTKKFFVSDICDHLKDDKEKSLYAYFCILENTKKHSEIFEIDCAKWIWEDSYIWYDETIKEHNFKLLENNELLEFVETLRNKYIRAKFGLKPWKHKK